MFVSFVLLFLDAGRYFDRSEWFLFWKVFILKINIQVTILKDHYFKRPYFDIPNLIIITFWNNNLF